MGTLLDTSVLIGFERNEATLPPTDMVGMSVITFSELLRGVHRASARHRPTRLAFVENLPRLFPVIPFSGDMARVHAQLWDDARTRGRTPGISDLIIASTAIVLGWEVATADHRGFDQIPGLSVRYV